MEWLQFADFHFGKRNSAQQLAMGSLNRFIAENLSQKPGKIDAVLIVGDIAFSGHESEYVAFENDFLKPLLSLSALEGAKVIAVPGNHDVTCDASAPISWDGIKERNQAIVFCETEEGRKFRAQRSSVFSNYQQFVKRNNIMSPDTGEEISCLLTEGTLPFDVLAVNTALFCDKDEESELPIIPCPLDSLRHRILTVQQNRPLIIIGHHPLNNFMREQQRPFESFLIDNKAVYLHGHEHDPKLTSNPDGTVRTLGFGATYLSPLGKKTHSPYCNSFVRCCLDQNLWLNGYSWDDSVGRWQDSTRSQFSSCATQENYDKGAIILNLPVYSKGRDNSIVKTALPDIPRKTPHPQSISPISVPSDKVWLKLLLLSDNVHKHYRNYTEKDEHTCNTSDGKAEFIIEQAQKRNLLVCIPATTHILSAKEIENYNTRLDTEDYRSVTVLSFGKMSGEARDMYLRLKNRKNIEVMVNNELASKWHKLLSGKQIELLMAQDAGMDTASILIDADDIYVLLIRASEAMSFKVIDSAGGIIASSSAIVARLRDGNSSFARMAYENEPNALPNRAETLAFDENHYLQKCYEECNVMKYAALANVGIRFSEFSLDEVYISASACEIAEGNSNRINALLDDQLASFPISPGLKKHIKQQYVNNTDDQDRHETSQAREFCQQYGAILLTGDPGSGKTCFVKSEILSYARRAIVAEVDSVEVKDEWHSGHVPVLVQLSQVAAEADLDSAGLLGIASRLLERRGFCFPADKMNDLFKQGRLALFFDGLDEIVSVEKRALVVQHINKMVTECLLSGNRIVVTSRPVAINVVNLLPSLRRLELQGLTDVEIRKLAAKILSLNIVETKDGPIIDEGEMRISDSTIIKQLLQDCAEKPGVARFATNPLLLTLLVVIYANSGAPSAKRHRIYEEAVKTLASVRGRQAGHEPVSLQDLRERLGAVALSVYRKESGLLPTRSEVVEIIRNVMTRQIGVPVTKAEADKFVQRVAESTGLISIGGNDGKGDDAAIVTFMHHSFMEYFAAVGLNRELDKADVKSLILQPRWIEILTLLAGIIGENADIAPVLAKFIGNGDDYGDVDARFLIFALDCALECEVPSEAALRLLSISWSKCLEKGTARLDPWVRSEIGSRLSQLIMACGIGSFEAGLLSALRNSDPCACAAAISLASYACVGVVAAPEIVKAINESCSSSETVIQIAICEAAGRVDWFRTCLTRQVIARCLRKGVDSKSAAFEAIIEIPGLATNHWEEIVAGLEESDVKLRRLASKAAVQAGLDGDLVALSESKKNQIANALQYMCESGLSYEYPSSKIRQTTIDILMNSGYLRDRLIGIQLLPAIDGGGDVVYRELMNVLDKSVDHHELTAGLRALRSSPEARVLVTIPDLRKIIKLSEEGTSDVRSAGIQLLGCFGADVVSIRSLIGRDWSLLATSEFENVCHALGRAQVLQEEVTLVIEKEIVKRTREGVKKNESYIREICALLDAARNLGKNLNVEVGGVIRELILDYRQDEKVKQAAVRAYPAVAVPSPLVVEFLAKLFKSSPPGLLSELVQTLAIFAKNCRQSVESVLANVEALSKLQATAIEMHHMLQKREPSADTEYLVTELRNGIYEVSQIIITFEEYLKPHPVRGIA